MELNHIKKITTPIISNKITGRNIIDNKHSTIFFGMGNGVNSPDSADNLHTTTPPTKK